MSRINTYESRKNYYRHLTRPNGEPLSEKDCLLLDLCCQWTKDNNIATSTYHYLLNEKFIRQNHPRTVKRTFDNISLYIEAEFKNIHVIYGVTHKDRIRIERVADFDLKMEEAKQKNQGKSSKKGVQKCPPSSTRMSTMVDRNVDPSTFIYKNTKKNTINDNHDYQENQFLKISELSEEGSDSFYEIYEECFGKDLVFEAEEEPTLPIANSKTDSWRIVAKDYHKPISAAFFADNNQFIQTEMLRLQTAGYDITETEDNHKINLNSNKGTLEKSVCLEAPRPLEAKQFIETAVKRLADESSGVEIIHSDQATDIVQTEVNPQKQAVIHQFNPLKDRVSRTCKNGNTYWGIPLSKFRYSKAMIEQIRVDSKKAHFTHEQIVGLFSYIAEKYPDKLIFGGKAGFISYMTKVVNGEMEYNKEEKLESIEKKRIEEMKELEDMFNNGRIQWA